MCPSKHDVYSHSDAVSWMESCFVVSFLRVFFGVKFCWSKYLFVLSPLLSGWMVLMYGGPKVPWWELLSRYLSILFAFLLIRKKSCLIHCHVSLSLWIRGNRTYCILFPTVTLQGLCIFIFPSTFFFFLTEYFNIMALFHQIVPVARSLSFCAFLLWFCSTPSKQP